MVNALCKPMLGFFLLVLPAVGQAQELPFAEEDEKLTGRIELACDRLRVTAKLVPCAELLAKDPEPGMAGALPPQVAVPPERAPLAPTQVYQTLRRSMRAVGHYYRCLECEDWHFNPSSGFALDGQGRVVTCAHVLPPDAETRDAFLVCADLDGNVWPVEKVLAIDRKADLAVLQTSERGAVGIELSGGAAVGARVYCLSNPDGMYGYFSEGIVARRYLYREPADEADPDGVRRPPAQPLLDVTCQWAGGSSGGPVVDAWGRLVGVVQSTQTVSYPDEDDRNVTELVVRSAVPVESLRKLFAAATAKAESKPVDAPTSKK
ncbi:MAG: hypothetical protein RL398_2303 [Planctomycetota bacterium]|jgi:hypothetical protein